MNKYGLFSFQQKKSLIYKQITVTKEIFNETLDSKMSLDDLIQ